MSGALDAASLVAGYLAENAPVWTETTRRGARHGLTPLLRFLGPGGRLGEEQVRAYVRVVQAGRRADGQPLAALTRRSRLERLRALLRWAYRRGLTLSDWGEQVPRVVAHLLPRPLGVAQVARLLAVASQARDRAVVELLYGTGLRASELVRLRVSDLGDGVVHVRLGKGRKDRLVPLGAVAGEALHAYLRVRGVGRSEALLLGASGRALTVSGLEQLLRRLARRLDFTASPHRLRHSYATHLLRGGASVRHVQALLGHASVDSTAVYTEVVVDDLHALLRRCHPRERKRRRVRGRRAQDEDL